MRRVRHEAKSSGARQAALRGREGESTGDELTGM